MGTAARQEQRHQAAQAALRGRDPGGLSADAGGRVGTVEEVLRAGRGEFTMTTDERIAALEARLALAEGRLAAVEAKIAAAGYPVPQLPVGVPGPHYVPPGWPWHETICQSGEPHGPTVFSKC